MIAVVASLQGELVRLRPLRREDAPRLAEIGSHPEVARWWPDITVEELVAKAEGRDEVEAFAIEHDGELVGLGQIYEHSNPEFRHAGIDLFLDPRLHGRGLGRDAVRTLGRWLVEERGHHRVVIDPAAANETFLVSDGQDLSTPELIRRMAGAMGRPARLFGVPPLLLMAGATALGMRDIAQRLLGSFQLKIAKAYHVLNWLPPLSIDDELKRAVADN